MSQERRCQTCQKILVRKKNESQRLFLVREHCGEACWPERRCEQCGRVLKRNAKEPVPMFLRRLFCSRRCYGNNRMQHGQRRTSDHGCGLCPCHREPRPDELAEVARRTAEIRRRKQAELDASTPRDEDGREIPAAVEITVVPIRSLGVTPIWNWED